MKKRFSVLGKHRIDSQMFSIHTNKYIVNIFYMKNQYSLFSQIKSKDISFLLLHEIDSQ